MSSSFAPPVNGGVRKHIALGLGAVVIADQPAVVRTVLGSCVAVILHAARLRVSAVCHAQLPEREAGTCCRETCPQPCSAVEVEPNELKYVTCCIRYMLEELARRWVRREEIICTLVGGANVVRNIDVRWSVGDRNVEAALCMLQREGIKVRHRDTGGNKGRVIEHVSDLNRTQIRYHEGPG